MSTPVLVTGAAGFIGSHTCQALISRGQSVVGVDNFDPFYDPWVKRRNLAELARATDGLVPPGGRAGTFELVEGVFCDARGMADLVKRHRPSGVIHLAAKAGVRPSIADPAAYARANVVGTASVLEAARAGGCARVVVASSSSVYGNQAQAPFREEGEVDRPISPYAATKRAAELLAYAHWRLTSMPTACLRFFTVYGPRQRPDLAIQTFLLKAVRDEVIPVFGDGSTSRDYTYIDDIVAGVLAAYERIGAPGIAGDGYRVWNLGGHRPVRLSELLDAIARVVGRPVRTEPRPMQAGDVERTWADLTRSASELGYRPRVGFEEGLARQWSWLQDVGS